MPIRVEILGRVNKRLSGVSRDARFTEAKRGRGLLGANSSTTAKS